MSHYSVAILRGSQFTCTKWIKLIIYCLVLADQRVLSLNEVLDLKGTYPYLINKTSGEIIQPRDYMDFENIFAPSDTYKQQQTAQGKNYHLLKAFDFANYFQSDYWHYSNEEDLRLSAHPVANERRCAQQLDWLNRQLNYSKSVLFQKGEQHVNLMSLMDAYGRPEAGTYLGHGHWLGSYYECTRASIDIRKFELEECLRRNATADGCLPATTKFSATVASLNTVNLSNEPEEPPEALLKARYCLGKARDIDWPNDDNYVPRISYKVGLCLPESCETLSFRRHKALIEQLMLYNMQPYMKSRIYLDDIYCLPDQRSPIRALNLSALIFLGLGAGWLLILVTATWLDSHCHKESRSRQINKTMADEAGPGINLEQQQFKLRLSTKDCQINNNSGTGTDLITTPPQTVKSQCLNCAPEVNKHSGPKSAITNGIQLQATLSATNTLETNGAYQVKISNELGHQQDCHSNDHDYQLGSLPSSYQSSGCGGRANISAWPNGSSPLLIKTIRALSIWTNIMEFPRPPLLLRNPDATKRLRINLNALDFIKCACCVLVIFGHVVFINMQHQSDIIHYIELSNELAPRILISFFNFVDTFFIISGMLTAYFVFKRFNKKTFASPLVWLSVSLLRLARLSPVYILVFWFAKTLVVYMGEGPLWDYGTDKNSIKGLCINDHWWKSILYIGNLGTMQPLCILPAWSIIVDSQYSIMLPPILFIIFRYKRLGYLGLLIATVIFTTRMSIQLANQTAVKTSDMSKVRLHVYPLISRFAAEFYNATWNRIGPVAIGIFGGHMLYLYDIGKIRRWPWFMRNLAFKIILMMHLFIFMLPSLGLITDPPESNHNTDLTIFVISNATIKPIWAIINTVFLLRLVTDLRRTSVLARAVSHNIWHCLGKLCFASYLLHYEIILMLLKSNKQGLAYPNWLNVLREFSVAFLISTIVSYFVYILFEAPINNLFMLNFAKPKIRTARDSGSETGSIQSNEKIPTTV